MDMRMTYLQCTCMLRHESIFLICYSYFGISDKIDFVYLRVSSFSKHPSISGGMRHVRLNRFFIHVQLL